MNYHPEMTLDAEDVSQVQAAIGRAFAFWASLYKNSGGVSDEVAKAGVRHARADAFSSALGEAANR